MRWAVAVLLLVGALGAGVWLGLRRERTTAPSVDVATHEPSAPAAPALPRARPSEAPHLTVGEAPPDLALPGKPAPAELSAELGAAFKNLLLAAKPCAKPGLDPKQNVHVSGTFVVKNGEAQLRNPTIADGTLSDEGVRGCLRDAFARAHWRTPSHDRELEWETEISVEDFVR